jgi:hypothetical protein
MKRIVTVLTLFALLAVAGPAAAKPRTLHYSGETHAGLPMQFALKGNRIFGLDGYISTTCAPTKGVPVTRRIEFDPPGSFRLGRTSKVSRTEHITWWGDTTFHYRISSTRIGRRWHVKLHVNYSYVQFLLPGGGEVDQTGYVCQGDDKFTFKARGTRR